MVLLLQDICPTQASLLLLATEATKATFRMAARITDHGPRVVRIKEISRNITIPLQKNAAEQSPGGIIAQKIYMMLAFLVSF